MIILDELRVEMTGYRKNIEELGEVLDIKNAREEVARLQEQAQAPDFSSAPSSSRTASPALRRWPPASRTSSP